MDAFSLKVSAPVRARYPHVFEPISIGAVEIRNRMYMPPHGIPIEAPLPGREAYRVPAADFAAYYAERARGGVGLMFHSTTVGPIGRQPINVQASPWWPEAVQSYRRVAEAVHEHGAKLMAQIWYAPFEPHMWEPLGPEAPPLGPSANGDFLVARVAHAMSKRRDRQIRGNERPDGTPPGRRRVRRDRRPCLPRSAHRAVHLAELQQAHGRVRRIDGEPPADPPRGARGHAPRDDDRIAVGIRITVDELLETGSADERGTCSATLSPTRGSTSSTSTSRSNRSRPT